MIFQLYLNKIESDFEKGVAEKIKYDRRYLGQSDIFLKLLYNFYKPSFVEIGDESYYSFDVFAATIRHTIWCIKNKMINGKCNNPIFVSIQGEQGCGKSSFARHLGQTILDKMYAELRPQQINDTFGNAIWEKIKFANFEDIDKDDKVGIGALKSLITQQVKTNRNMHLESFSNTQVKTTFFATSNLPIWEIFNDSTGMRRFVDLKFNREPMQNDKQAQQYCDKLWEDNLLSLWKSVDENKYGGYLFENNEAELLDLARTTYVCYSDTVKQFIDRNSYKVVSNRCSKGMTLDIAYKEYQQFCIEISKTFCNEQNFKDRIRNMYQGKTKLKPSKLKLISTVEYNVIETDVDDGVGRLETYKGWKDVDVPKCSPCSTGFGKLDSLENNNRYNNLDYTSIENIGNINNNNNNIVENRVKTPILTPNAVPAIGEPEKNIDKYEDINRLIG